MDASSFPKLQIGILLGMQTVEPIAATVIFPFVVQLVNELGVTHGNPKLTGYYVGLIESIFFATESIFMLQWGRLSDRIGRRPVLLIGLFGLGLSMVCVGLSTTFIGLVISRSISDILNGNTGVMKTTMAEITDEDHLTQACSWLPLAWLVGSTIGPFLGGYLQHPAEHFPRLFGGVPFWEKYPYFLPCLVAGFIPISLMTFSYVFLRESLSLPGRGSKCPQSITEWTPLTTEPTTPDLTFSKHPSIQSLLTPRVRIVLLNYACLACASICLYCLFPLFLAVPISSGGMGLNPSAIGKIMSSVGLGGGIIQAACFPPAYHRWGAKPIMMAGMCRLCILFMMLPIMHQLALRRPPRQEGLPTGVFYMLPLYIFLIGLKDMCYSCVFMFVTAAVASRDVLGATNGLAQTIISLVRALGPAGATALSLFSLSVEHHVAGGYFVFFFLAGLSMVGVVCTSLLPSSEGDRSHADSSA